MLIEPTDEMANAADQAHKAGESWMGIAGAVLAVVQRDYDLRLALCDEPCPSEPGAYCELPRGHAANSGRGHSASVNKAVDW